MNEDTPHAKIYQCIDPNIKICADKIIDGELVIFPTETVYGIGANALNDDAVQKIYTLKKRPSNNPLIVHVLDWETSKIYTNVTDKEDAIIYQLTKHFWPGPLTILIRKNKYISDRVTANSDWVALRSPLEPVARKLIKHSMLPIAAPSANISGKVSSTYKEHILHYFKEADVSILASNEPCKIGIESTIVKIEELTNDKENSFIDLTIVRPGIITNNDILYLLKNNTVKNNLETIHNINIDSINIKNSIPTQQTNSPGSDISHYTISKNVVIFNFLDIEQIDMHTKDIKDDIIEKTNIYCEQSICVDFGGKNKQFKDKFYGYVDLSENGDIREAIFNFYNVLHQLNNVDCKNVLIFEGIMNNYTCGEAKVNDATLRMSLYDRIYRCCSGKRTYLPITLCMENTLENIDETS